MTTEETEHTEESWDRPRSHLLPVGELRLAGLRNLRSNRIGGGTVRLVPLRVRLAMGRRFAAVECKPTVIRSLCSLTRETSTKAVGRTDELGDPTLGATRHLDLERDCSVEKVNKALNRWEAWGRWRSTILLEAGVTVR